MNDTSIANEMETRMAIQKGTVALKQLRGVFESAARNLAQYEMRYEQSNDLEDKADILNYALFHVTSSVMQNARTDLAARAQAKLHAISMCKAKA